MYETLVKEFHISSHIILCSCVTFVLHITDQKQLLLRNFWYIRRWHRRQITEFIDTLMHLLNFLILLIFFCTKVNFPMRPAITRLDHWSVRDLKTRTLPRNYSKLVPIQSTPSVQDPVFGQLQNLYHVTTNRPIITQYFTLSVSPSHFTNQVMVSLLVNHVIQV